VRDILPVTIIGCGEVGAMKNLLASLVLLGVCAWGADIYAAEPKPNWQSEWEKTVQGAKREGKLSLYLLQGEGELSAVAQLFQKKYPEINVVVTPGRGNTLAPRIMAERRAGKYLVDAYISGVTTAYEVFYRAKILDSVRAALILPEVIDESKWWLGQHQYVDPENRYIFVYVGNVGEYVSYHTKSVEAGEIRSHWDFLHPKWKGKMLSRDPKISGSQRIGLRMFYHTPELGAEFIRRLYGEMDITITQEIRQATDWLAAGKFAICFFCSEILKAKGQGVPVDEFRTAQWREVQAISAGNKGSVVLLSQPPHPNAARLFVNWLLSREGQIAFQRTTNTPTNSEESMRVDIPKDMVRSEVRRVEGVRYLLAEKPEFMDMAPILEIVTKAQAQSKSGK
jgi:iron(III) transport system substrate-binding protein